MENQPSTAVIAGMKECLKLGRGEGRERPAMGLAGSRRAGRVRPLADVAANGQHVAMSAIWIILGLGAWIAATLLPPYLSVLFRKKAKQAHAPWPVHLAFAPTMLAVAWCSAFLVTLADGDQDRVADERGLGVILLPAMLI